MIKTPLLIRDVSKKQHRRKFPPSKKSLGPPSWVVLSRLKILDFIPRRPRMHWTRFLPDLGGGHQRLGVKRLWAILAFWAMWNNSVGVLFPKKKMRCFFPKWRLFFQAYKLYYWRIPPCRFFGSDFQKKKWPSKL